MFLWYVILPAGQIEISHWLMYIVCEVNQWRKKPFSTEMRVSETTSSFLNQCTLDTFFSRNEDLRLLMKYPQSILKFKNLKRRSHFKFLLNVLMHINFFSLPTQFLNSIIRQPIFITKHFLILLIFVILDLLKPMRRFEIIFCINFIR